MSLIGNPIFKPQKWSNSMNRRLIRPNLAEIRDSREKENRDQAKRKMHPPYETHAENYYYLKQMNKKTRMAVAFADGEVIEGYIEWYDRQCFKLNRENAPNLLVYKANIKYLYKLEDVTEKEKEEEETKKKMK
jgi:sRNA-binding regulator protein Hfq